MRSQIRANRRQLDELLRNDDADSTSWDWIADNRWLSGQPWSWEGVGPRMLLGDHDLVPEKLSRPYLRQYINDKCPERSVSKSRQSEFTEAAINGQLELCCKIPGFKAQHVFPIAELAREVSGEKIHPAIMDSPRIKNRIRRMAVHSIKFKNSSTYVIIGSLSRTAGRTTSKDLVAYDEYDYLAAVEAVMDEQISHSEYKIKWRFSTPTSPNVGIDLVVQKGSEFIWRWPCERCGTVQEWKYPDSIINYFEPSSSGFDERSPEYRNKLKQVYFGCTHCAAYCDRNSDYYAANAFWEPLHLSMVGIHNSYRQVAGMIPWKTGMEILELSHKLIDYPTQFQNEVWGSPHLGGEARLHETELERCGRGWRAFYSRTEQMRFVSIGIDPGKRESWLVVRSIGVDLDERLPCLIAFWRVDDRLLDEWGLKGHPNAHAEAYCRICERYGAERIVVDANGIGADRFDYLLNRFPHKERVWGAFFDTAEEQRQARQSRLLVPQWNKEKHTVMFSKVNELKKIQGEVRRGRVGIPSKTSDSAEIIRTASEHHAGLAVQKRWDMEKAREFEIAVKVRPHDHLLCGNMYSRIGMEGLSGFGTESGARVFIGGAVVG